MLLSGCRCTAGVGVLGGNAHHVGDRALARFVDELLGFSPRFFIGKRSDEGEAGAVGRESSDRVPACSISSRVETHATTAEVIQGGDHARSDCSRLRGGKWHAYT